MRTRIVRTIAYVLALSLLVSSLPAHAAGTAIFNLTSVRTTYSVGETITMAVEVQPTTTPINVARIIASFPTNLLRVQQFSLGTDFPFLSPPGITLDNTNGVINAGGYILNNSLPAHAVLGSVTFTALATGTATISTVAGAHLISPDQIEQLDLANSIPLVLTIGTPPPPANRPPTFTSIGTQQVTLGNDVQFTAHASDPDGDHVTLTGTTLPAGAVFTPGPAAASVAGSFAWTPTQAGTYQATFTATDDRAGDPRSSQQTVTIQVNTPINPSPVFTPVGTQSIQLGASVNFAVTASDAADLVLLSWTLPSGATFTATANNAHTAGGNFSWTPTAQGIYYATFTATDNSPLGSQAAQMTVPIYVSIPANSAPVIDPIQEMVVNAGTLVHFTVHATDSGDPVILSALVPPGASFTPGTPSTNVSGAFSWTPTVNGIYTVAVTAQDTNQYNPLARQATVRITVFGGVCPQIDQTSCTILTGDTCAPTEPTAPTCEARGLTEPVLPNAATPLLSSPTHPKQDTWYATNSPRIEWELDAEAQGVGLSLDQSEHSVPGDGIISKETTSFTYTQLSDGAWFVHAKAHYPQGWSTSVDYKLNIDTTSPRILPPYLEPVAASGATTPLYLLNLSAYDTHSGIDHYELSVDGSHWQTVAMPYALSSAEQRGTTASVRVYDRAGNRAETSFNLRDAIVQAKIAVPYTPSKPLPPPIVDTHVVRSWVGVFTRREALIFKGTATPNTILTLFVDSNPQYSGTTAVNQFGNWEYIFVQPLAAGEHHAWAMSSQGSTHSAPSNMVAFTLSTAYFPHAKNYWWLWILPLLIILILWYRSHRRRKKMEQNLQALKKELLKPKKQ